MSCPPGTTCKSWGSEVVRGSAIIERAGPARSFFCCRLGLAAAGATFPAATRLGRHRSEMPADPEPVTLAQVVHRAVEVCEDSISDGLDELLQRFEDADKPITAVEDIEQLLDERLGPIDADENDGALTMARAVIVYLAHRRDTLDEDPAELLRLAARAEFHGQPPEHVERWLVGQGIEM